MKYLQVLLFLIFLPTLTIAQLRLSLESGVVSTQYNDVRSPNGDQDPGTLFSFKEDFGIVESSIFLRAEIAYTFNNKHTFEATTVPLTIEYKDLIRDPIDFAGVTFLSGDLLGTYKFNTYRFSYRYRLVNRKKLKFDLGASLLVRDARIAIKQGPFESDDTDLGFVPLVSFELDYAATSSLSLFIKGDALVGPVGRAEDIFGGILYDIIDDKLQLKAGYRLIEGGADVDQVYNFAYFHFADFGVILTL